MFRVVTKYRDQSRSRPVVERGPWLPARQEAEFWAEQLRAVGYVVAVESQHGAFGGGQHDELAAAMASMA
ncbi:MAG TPA: hypothetical protein VF096_03680 [Azonexus sp.]